MTRHLPEQARRDQILAAARSCFIQRGFHPTRMEDIAATAGLSKGGVYFHFQSKQEVFDALVQEEFERSMNVLKNVSESAASVAEKMQALGRYYLEYFSGAPDAPRFFIVMGEMALRDEAIARRLLHMQSAYIDQIAALVDQGAREQVLRPVDSRVAAALLKALLDGIEGLQALGYPMDLLQFVGVGMELVLTGLAARPVSGESERH